MNCPPSFFIYSYVHAVFSRLRFSFHFLHLLFYFAPKYRSIWFFFEEIQHLQKPDVWFNRTESNQNIKQERNKFKATRSFSSAEWKWKANSSSEYFSLRYLLYIAAAMTQFNDICKKNRHWLEIIFFPWKLKIWFEKLLILFLANLTCFIFRIKNFTFFSFDSTCILVYKLLHNWLLYLLYFLVFISHFIIHKKSNKKLTLFVYIHMNTHKYTCIFAEK